MHTNRVLVNAKQIHDLTGVDPGLLKYHRNEQHIKGYRLTGEREWLYRLDQVNRLFVNHITKQTVPKLVIVDSNSTLQLEGNTA